jgi:hypothetical protein
LRAKGESSLRARSPLASALSVAAESLDTAAR